MIEVLRGMELVHPVFCGDFFVAMVQYDVFRFFSPHLRNVFLRLFHLVSFFLISERCKVRSFNDVGET